MELSGKVGVLTGGKRLGAYLAEALAARGVHLILSYRHSKTAAEKTARAAARHNVSAYAMRADLTKETDVKKLFAFATKKFKKVDFLVHMASTFESTPFEKLSEKIWMCEINNNLTTSFLCGLEAGRVMKKQKNGGKIIFFGDSKVYAPYKGKLPYFAAKAGVHQLTKMFALELSPKISVNCIAPGMVLPTPEYKKKLGTIAKKTLLHKIGKPEDVASTTIFLLENDFITGQVVRIDGGMQPCGAC